MVVKRSYINRRCSRVLFYHIYNTVMLG